MIILNKWYCHMFGHKWRRLTKKERKVYAAAHVVLVENMVSLPQPSPQLRRCARCFAEKMVTARKPKAE